MMYKLSPGRNIFWKRRIPEAIEIRTQQPSLIRDAGYDLPAIYNDLLLHDFSQTGGHVIRGERHHNAEWRGRDDLASYVFNLN